MSQYPEDGNDVSALRAGIQSLVYTNDPARPVWHSTTVLTSRQRSHRPAFAVTPAADNEMTHAVTQERPDSGQRTCFHSHPPLFAFLRKCTVTLTY